MTSTPSPEQQSQRISLLTSQFAHHIDIYKHHFDFFLKAVGLYVTLTGALGWTIFAANVEVDWKAAAATTSAAIALLSLHGSFFSMRWVKSVEQDVRDICLELGLKPIVFKGAKDTIQLAAMLTIIILVASVGCATLFFLD